MIDSKTEDKYVSQNIIDNVLFNSSVTNSFELYPCIPVTAQGVGSFQRIGQQLSPKSLHVKGTVALSDDNATADIVVFMYVFTTKKYKHLPDLVTLFNVNGMLADGNGGTTNPTGTALVATYPPEKEQIRVLFKKEFHLQKGYGPSNGGLNTALGVGGGSSTIRHFDVKIKTPSKLQYVEGAGSAYPTNFAPVVCFGYYHCDGTVPDSVNRALNVNACAQMVFEDA